MSGGGELILNFMKIFFFVRIVLFPKKKKKGIVLYCAF